MPNGTQAGISKLARLLGWHYSTLWRKLKGLSRITHSDELAIRQAVTSLKATELVGFFARKT